MAQSSLPPRSVRSILKEAFRNRPPADLEAAWLDVQSSFAFFREENEDDAEAEAEERAFAEETGAIAIENDDGSLRVLDADGSAQFRGPVLLDERQLRQRRDQIERGHKLSNKLGEWIVKVRPLVRGVVTDPELSRIVAAHGEIERAIQSLHRRKPTVSAQRRNLMWNRWELVWNLAVSLDRFKIKLTKYEGNVLHKLLEAREKEIPRVRRGKRSAGIAVDFSASTFQIVSLLADIRSVIRPPLLIVPNYYPKPPADIHSESARTGSTSAGPTLFRRFVAAPQPPNHKYVIRKPPIVVKILGVNRCARYYVDLPKDAVKLIDAHANGGD
jgi:hypothetical protein